VPVEKSDKQIDEKVSRQLNLFLIGRTELWPVQLLSFSLLMKKNKF